MQLISKLILFLIYPFVWLFHPRMRRYHELRLKYWAKDNDFFREERKILGLSFVAAVFGYFVLFHGIGAAYYTFKTASYEAKQNYKEALHEAHEAISVKPEERTAFDYNKEDTTERVEVTAEDHAARAKEIETRVDIAEDADRADALLQEALRKKKCRESGKCE